MKTATPRAAAAHARQAKSAAIAKAKAAAPDLPVRIGATPE